ncbi:MAG: molecular chaperone DnaJ [Methylomonas sp.]|nr:MAG: molecular chaperone DnaJ [Methylomonas sp.]PPD38860.1 MAG: molecular chaperone DnaJ [Methylomonas sp.]PPD41706.1 MAG: molecular chaperone DnaJ [Methylomonas sp.]
MIFVFRIVLIILVFFMIYLLIKRPMLLSSVLSGQFLKKTGLLIAFGLLVLLAATGKLHWLFAMIGAVLAFLMRSLPVIMRYAPQLHRLWAGFVGGKTRPEEHVSDNFRQSAHKRQAEPMTRTEAFQVLGLAPDATEAQIVMAHRRLMAKLHPDKGGSDYLASRINLARKVLLES